MALYLGNQRVSPNMITPVSGVTPSGTKNITDTSLTDVSIYQYAQVSDGNLVAENIKKDVSILGITGTLEATTPVSGTLQITSNGTFDVSDKQYAEVNVAARLSNPKTVVPSAASQTVLPDQGDDGLSQVTVSGDSNLVAGNIKQGVSIFNVEGTLVPAGPDAGKLKLLPPTCWIDWDNDKYCVLPNPYTSGGINISENIDINGEIITKDPDSNGGNYNSNNIGNYKTFMFYNNPISHYLSYLNAGSYKIKSSSKFKNVPKEIYYNGVSFNDEQIVAHTRPVGYLDSDYSDEIVYERWNFTNSVQDLILVGQASGILNNHKYDAGRLLDYNLELKYTNSAEGSTYGFDADQLLLTSTNNGKSNSFSYAKISFTLDSDTEIILKCRSYGENNYDYGIVSKIDKELSKSTSNDGATGSDLVLHNFKTESSPDWKNVTFGTVSAGAHYFTLKYVKDSGGNSFDDNFKVELPETLTSKISIGKYLPQDITVTNSNDSNPIYSYSNVTGEFSIAMTGNITMTAVGSNTPPVSSTYGYKVNEDASGYILSEFNDNSMTSVTVPSEYKGRPVTGLANTAFSGNTKITNLVIPESIKTIEEGSLRGCSSLVNLTIPFIGRNINDNYPFGIIFGKEEYEGSNAVEQHYHKKPNDTYWSGNYFYIPTSLKSLTILGGYLNERALMNIKLNSLTLEKGIIDTQKDFFGAAVQTEISTINYNALIPDSSFTNIDYWLEYANNSVLNIGDSIIKVPFGLANKSKITSVSIGKNVKHIRGYVFADCPNLETIAIPNNVEKLENHVFAESKKLKSVVIGTGIKEIGMRCFTGCSSLFTIYYRGTEEQWNAISKGSLWDENMPSGYQIIYNYKD